MFHSPIFKTLCVLLLTTTTHSLFANWYLDEMMSSRDKKRTGVAKLSPRQKKSLQAWINKHFVLRDSEEAQNQQKHSNQPTKQPPHVSEIIQNGKYLKLSDNSVWEIHPADRPTVEGWITPANVEISTGKNQSYPYVLKNDITKTTVLAKKVAPLIDNTEGETGIETNIPKR